MAGELERGSAAARPGTSGLISALYREASRFPSVAQASVGVGLAACCGAKCLPLYTEWHQSDLAHGQQLLFSRQYILHRDGKAIVSVTPFGMPAEIRKQLLMRVSPTRRLRAILAHHFEMGQKQEVLEDSTLGKEPPSNIALSGSSWHTYSSHSPPPYLHNGSGRGAGLWHEHYMNSMPVTCPAWEYDGPCPVLISVSQQVWSNSGRVRSVNLTILDKHGRIYTDGQFGCLSWSHSESQILYVAERKCPKVQLLFPQDRSPQEGEKQDKARKISLFYAGTLGKLLDPVPKQLNIVRFQGKQSVKYDNWGEALGDKSIPALCLLNIKTGEVSVPEGIPGDISPGQALWSPDDKSIVFIGWWHEPFRLGLSACSNRRSALFFLDLSRSSCELLSSDHQAVSCPRLSPDGTHLVYLEGPVFGPHRQCLKLKMLNWQTKLTSTVIDVVRTATAGFYGIYSGALPLLCWADDNCRILLNTPQRSKKELLVVDTKLGSVKSITAGTTEGSWTLLGIEQDLLVVTCSSPNCPPNLKVGVLPPVGNELELQWMNVEEASVLPDMEWKILTVQVPVTEESIPYTSQTFEALLLKPRGSAHREKAFPLIVSPHGGPHAVFDACWRPTMACLCQLGFAVLMVNYRGSLGFGQASIDSLISRVGVQDVKDTQLAVELALQMEPLDPNRMALLGGSHGGFICCHLLGQYPGMYKACAVRSPVINMATLLGTSDIPDWRYAALGLPYCFERIPTEQDLAAMLLHSPITHAVKVCAPLLMCVGAKDQRVSPYQAREYYRVLRARGVPVQ
ncbi:hypothetical protein lerEdw1_016047 [Lerista edwardsae]|nr:hypothetical protein lerEdw1_016047 [Lerista edwardsae]